MELIDQFESNDLPNLNNIANFMTCSTNQHNLRLS